MSTTVKISQLPSALSGDITTNSDVLPIIDGDTTKQITVENLLAAAGTAVSGNLIPYTLGSDITSSFDLGSPTAVWQELYVATSSINFVDSGGVITKFTKKDVADLKAGKSISTDSNKKLVNSLDDTTYVRMGSSGRAWHYASNVPVLKLETGSITIGGTGTPVGIVAGMVVTGSTTLSGSETYVVSDLLSVLANYGQTGSFSVSGSTTLDGDVNADGAVTVQDLLTVLGGFGASGSCDVSGSLEISGSGLVINGDNRALVITGSTTTSGSFENTGSFEQSGSTTFTGGGFVVNDLLNLLANYGQTGIPTGSGEGGVSVGDINLDGQVNVTDLLLLLSGMGNPNCIVQNLTVPINTNYQMVGPEICVSQSIVVTVGNNSFFSIT